MQKLKKLPFVLAIILASVTAACSDIDVTPRTEDEEDPIIAIPPPSKSNSTSSDTTSIG